MKKKWKIYEFEKCLEKMPRYNKIPKNKFLLKGNFPIISQEKDFINGYWDNFEDVIEVKKPVVIFGDHTKVVKLIDFNFVVGADGVKIFQPIDEINAEYLAFFLQNIQLDDLGYARHYRLLKKVNVPIPPLEEQKTIVAKLDQAFAAIDQAKANIEKNIANAKELFQSKLNQIFSQKGDGWISGKLNSFINYDKTKNIKKLPYVGLENIESNTGIFLGSLEIGEVKSDTFHFSKEHILFGRLRPYLNKVLRPNFEGHCSTEIFPILIKDKLLIRDYLYYWLTSGITIDKINNTCTGARMPRANMNEVLNFEFSFPNSIETQQKIVTQLVQLQEQTNLLVTKYQQKLANLEELKKSILEKAFKGELV